MTVDRRTIEQIHHYAAEALGAEHIASQRRAAAVVAEMVTPAIALVLTESYLAMTVPRPSSVTTPPDLPDTPPDLEPIEPSPEPEAAPAPESKPDQPVTPETQPV